MIYRAIGVMSGSSLDGLDIVFSEFQENAGKWTYEIRNAKCYLYDEQWIKKLATAKNLGAFDYHVLHTEYGHFVGSLVNRFIDQFGLHYQPALICSHGHTVFHSPLKKMTAQLGDGAAIAAETSLPVVCDLRSLDVAFSGQGAPIVPIGEKLLLGDHDAFLNLGGIANISFKTEPYVAFDVCPANRVLNLLANEVGKQFDSSGELAATGMVDDKLLAKLNNLSYYAQQHPKSLANEFGTEIVYPLVKDSDLRTSDALRTFVEHIAIQIRQAISNSRVPSVKSILVTGGGAFNEFLVERLRQRLADLYVNVVVPNQNLVKFKEAMIMAFIGVLRWRQEYNVLSSVTGAIRDSISGALWIGQEA